MRPTIWVLIGLVLAAALASWAFVAGAPTGLYLTISFWTIVAIGTTIRIISAARGRKVKAAAQPVVDGVETWESLYLNHRPPRLATVESPPYTVTEPTELNSRSGIDLDRKRAEL
ncbi:hypothetical protein [Leifsonia sp. 1010]|uniref:hypothetical protein n=1 Tax=Leifsonia sp. 1010 TaxID=2817769 RepID=UPI00285BA52C|nr:hypothetical protein [Leifsonia sp. 1010]MDR6611236.1 hypothetical protein [Leifsonia sp. 1010]